MSPTMSISTCCCCGKLKLCYNLLKRFEIRVTNISTYNIVLEVTERDRRVGDVTAGPQAPHVYWIFLSLESKQSD